MTPPTAVAPSSSSTAATTAAPQSIIDDPFLAHIYVLLSIYEVGSLSKPPPAYDGPTDWAQDIVIRGINSLARRMFTAEATLESIKKSADWESNGPGT
ncbi:hypothetical protein OF83DRAFT_1066675, partial [Amylostereum chailletii]